jgi:hypothetical protein
MAPCRAYSSRLRGQGRGRTRRICVAERSGRAYRLFRRSPFLSERIEECAGLLHDRRALPELSDDDRAFLLRAYDRLGHSLAAFTIPAMPVHGDAHMGNVFITPTGPLWTDFETACFGPREWDAAGVPHLPAFEPLDSGLYAALSDMCSLCVAVWCSALAHDPEKRAAAQYQLKQLKGHSSLQ